MLSAPLHSGTPQLQALGCEASEPKSLQSPQRHCACGVHQSLLVVSHASGYGLSSGVGCGEVFFLELSATLG